MSGKVVVNEIKEIEIQWQISRVTIRGGIITDSPFPPTVIENIQADPDGFVEFAGNIALALNEGKPKPPRKPRKDKGTHKSKSVTQLDVISPELRAMKENESKGFLEPITLSPEIAQLKKRTKKDKPLEHTVNPDISTFDVKTGQDGEEHILSCNGIEVAAMTLKEGVELLFATLKIDQAYVEAAPESEGKRNILNILKEEEDGRTESQREDSRRNI